MKHTLKITLILICIFFISQIAGIYILYSSIDKEKTKTTGEVTFTELPYQIERPQIEENVTYIYIIVGVLLGTGLVLLLIKFRKPKLWKVWYLISVVITLAISFSVFVNQTIAITIAIIFGLIKVFKPNVYFHNFTEIFVYSGIAVVFAPMMNIFSVIMLLILISIYDMYAVWKSKHMIKLAEFQKETKLFAGLSIPYSVQISSNKNIEKKGIDNENNDETQQSKTDDKNSETHKDKIFQKVIGTKIFETRNAVLGGGDIAFPLLFSGVLLKTYGLWQSFFIPVFSGVGLFILLLKSEKGKYYPAMPFISIGCFIGYFFIWILF
jgi:presenilin-like A22 family membrane protease